MMQSCVHQRLLVGFAALGLLAAGCGGPSETHFRSNKLYVEVQKKAVGEITEPTTDNISALMVGLFGAPDDPHLPAFGEARNVIDLDLLKMAAGPVSREETGRPHGLYREHCVHCHGITGDGMGPTAAWLNPYPRNYRHGIYKFKSTPGKQPPAHDDLVHILKEGIPGTAMPSFKLLADDEIAALSEYVKYLSIRGQVERSLIREAASELEEGDIFVDPDGGDDYSQGVKDKVATVINSWKSANDNRLEIPQRPHYEGSEMQASIDRGRELFHGKLAQCSKCHGDTGLGDGVTNDFDDWTKELTPNDPEVFGEYLAALGRVYEPLTPRNAIPRNLRLNVFRGGRRPIDIYRRIKIGITGSPMPAASAQLKDDQIWDLVNYVRNLPMETASEPPQDQPAFQRDRL